MPYLDEAARQLGISEKTLRRWLRLVEPPIAPTPHKYDRRYWLITDSDVEVIRAARSELPGSSRNITETIYTASELAFDRRSTADGERGIATDSFSPPAPTPRPRSARTQASSAGSLPDGLVSVAEVMRAHPGIRESTIRLWRDQGDIECDPREFTAEHGGWTVNRPLTRRGLAQFYAKAVEWERAKGGRSFVRCSACPHAEEVDG